MPQKLSRRRRGGFTLIELLVVIGIILVLMAILIPAAGMVRKRGYETRTRALIQKISAGCTAYYNDFNAYPGLLSESQFDGPLPAGISSSISSSENLVLSLAGGVALNGGLPSFDARLVNVGPQSLNLANPRQYPAYIEVASAELSTGMYGDPGKVVNSIQDSNVPEFVDSFPQQLPIIYERARSGARGIVNGDDGSDPLGGDPQYNIYQIMLYANHDTATQSTIPWGTPKYYKSWADYLRNPGLTPVGPSGIIAQNTSEVPRGKDSFILIDAGIDRKWYTNDDIFSSD